MNPGKLTSRSQTKQNKQMNFSNNIMDCGRMGGGSAPENYSLETTDNKLVNENDSREVGVMSPDIIKLLETVCNSSMESMIVIDVTGRIMVINNEALRLCGYNRWEIAGNNVKRLMPPRIASYHDSYLERYQRTKVKRIIGECRMTTMRQKDGTELPITLRVQEISLEVGKGYIAMLRRLTQEQELIRSKQMIATLLPKYISARIECGEEEIADEINATVVFIDIVEFTQWSVNQNPLEIVRMLNNMFSLVDRVATRHNVEKVKTIGDCYMAVCGTQKENIYDHAIRVTLFAKDVLQELKTSIFQVRIGIATGSMVAGVLTGARIAFDVWGDTVNLASRLQALAPLNRIMCSESTYQQTRFKVEFEPAQQVEVKGKGVQTVYVTST